MKVGFLNIVVRALVLSQTWGFNIEQMGPENEIENHIRSGNRGLTTAVWYHRDKVCHSPDKDGGNINTSDNLFKPLSMTSSVGVALRAHYLLHSPLSLCLSRSVTHTYTLSATSSACQVWRGRWQSVIGEKALCHSAGWRIDYIQYGPNMLEGREQKSYPLLL